ncbi:phage tail protein I [Pseudomonas resinovorans]|uniref:phage tail protein I n=1 Tax=Metapseudomonas resinovorans TaxID=53412 RepID=UPI00237F367A|nr:phage tail protein I [Pseudomonas resinovorans]MDE3738582.1 phage tail protein I [Pseudomonas resinovorans]
MSELLPPNCTGLEQRLANAHRHLSSLPVDIRQVRNPAACPVELLPYLAWELSVDEWNPSWGEDVKRRVVAQSVGVHRRKGTRGSVLRALEAIFGTGRFTLIEGAVAGFYDGSKRHNGLHFYGTEENWAMYSVLVDRPITLQQAAEVRRILRWVAPARCHLLALDFAQALHAYDGQIRYDNSYPHGVA